MMAIFQSQMAYFFGTFNPIHLGHLMMAETARQQFGFSKIVFVPAFDPPHRQADDSLINFAHREAMLRLAVSPNPAFYVSDIESRLPQPSYTIETLRQLIPPLENQPESVPFIIGTDALANLATWHQFEAMIQAVCFLQAPRSTAQMLKSITGLDGTQYPLNTHQLHMPIIDISSTDIRAQLAAGNLNRYTLPNSVADYIAWNKLY